ncbi:MAG: terpene cyclase/mutase family protein, partial [Chitinophagales bacterium]|nr:terpene cyclase/mutase family protein [Chitinophagales bacterium]
SSIQCEDGHFAGDYGGPHFLLPGLVVACYITETPLAEPHRTLITRYMLNHQNDDGGWGLHIEGQSTMFGTCMQYVSLRLLGYSAEHPRLAKAREWIVQHGGAEYIPPWGKFYLSCLGIYNWEGNNSLLPEMWLLPRWLPFFPGRYWCHARMVYLPMSYCYGVRLTAKDNPLLQQLRSEIYSKNYEQINWVEARNKCSNTDIYQPMHPILIILYKALNFYEKKNLKSLRKKALDFIISYIHAEDEQTNYIDIGPVNKVINMLSVWHACGKNSPQFQKHASRLKDYLWIAEDGMKMQGYNGSQLWDTAFAFQALHDWENHKLFASSYKNMFSFIEKQQLLQEPPKNEEFFRHSSIGGFPFSNKDHGWPITDCTAEGLKSLLKSKIEVPEKEERSRRAVDLLLSFQNNDGGWATYELTRAPRWIEKLNPSLVFGNIMIDYSYTECSSAALQALMLFIEQYPDYRNKDIQKAIQRGISFILSRQQSDGSWYGSWGVCFTYGTWFATEALSKAQKKGLYNTEEINNALNKAGKFLEQKQNEDGGWGEDFQSCVEKKYVHSKCSQAVNTAWAVLSLIRIEGFEKAAERGIEFILKNQLPNGDWKQQGISGVFNHSCAISYSNYRNIFPLWALAAYQAKALKK